MQHCYLADEFVDVGIKRRWIMFHDAVAHRVVVCKRCNAEDEREPHLNDLGANRESSRKENAGEVSTSAGA